MKMSQFECLFLLRECKWFYRKITPLESAQCVTVHILRSIDLIQTPHFRSKVMIFNDFAQHLHG
jgi:hypothetical protein